MSLALTLWKDWEKFLTQQGHKQPSDFDSLPHGAQDALLQKFEESSPNPPPTSAKAKQQFRLYMILIRRYLIYITIVLQQLEELYHALEATARRPTLQHDWTPGFLDDEEEALAEEEANLLRTK